MFKRFRPRYTITLLKLGKYELRYEKYYERKILTFWWNRLNIKDQKLIWWKSNK